MKTLALCFVGAWGQVDRSRSGLGHVECDDAHDGVLLCSGATYCLMIQPTNSGCGIFSWASRALCTWECAVGRSGGVSILSRVDRCVCRLVESSPNPLLAVVVGGVVLGAAHRHSTAPSSEHSCPGTHGANPQQARSIRAWDTQAQMEWGLSLLQLFGRCARAGPSGA